MSHAAEARLEIHFHQSRGERLSSVAREAAPRSGPIAFKTRIPGSGRPSTASLRRCGSKMRGNGAANSLYDNLLTIQTAADTEWPEQENNNRPTPASSSLLGFPPSGCGEGVRPPRLWRAEPNRLVFGVRHWTDAHTAILYVYTGGSSSGGGDSSSAFLFTLEFDLEGKCKITSAKRSRRGTSKIRHRRQHRVGWVAASLNVAGHKFWLLPAGFAASLGFAPSSDSSSRIVGAMISRYRQLEEQMMVDQRLSW